MPRTGPNLLVHKMPSLNAAPPLPMWAVDSAAQTRPARPSGVWPPLGPVNNAWHWVPALAC